MHFLFLLQVTCWAVLLHSHQSLLKHSSPFQPQQPLSMLVSYAAGYFKTKSASSSLIYFCYGYVNDQYSVAQKVMLF